MAKFNIAVELDWMDEEFNLDEEIKCTIVNNIVDKVKDRLVAQVDTECNNKIAEQMENIEKTVSDKLNGIMESFFNEPRDVTDRYGDVIKKGVTVKDTLKEACDNFLNQPMDSNGNPVSKSSYNAKYNTRVDYIVAKSINYDMDSAIKRAVETITKSIKDKVQYEVKKQMGDKLANILELDKMF